MVTIDETELEVYSTVLAVAFAARADKLVTEPFEYPIGAVMQYIKASADAVDTLKQLRKRIFLKALAVMEGEDL